ncbi:glycosyltransferase [Candidatus Parcubacteria bacterium]|nr:MAG: glycosyltransferase [Candidatus Parcubacteria bacterium]
MKRVLKQALLRRIFSWCDALLICGSAGEAYLKRYGVPECKIVRSPYEPNYDLIQNIAYDQVEKVRRKFGLVDGRRRLVYCGRLSREKRVDVLLRAFSRIVHERPLWDLLLIGDGPLRNELPSLIPGLDSDRVVWTGFQADAETIAALYKSCDVLVIPSDHEPWGLVVNEAVAAGLAVVASDVVGAARDLVQDGLNGMFFRPGDEDALVHALVRVTSDNTVDRLKIGSATVLKRWRKISDPVNGLRDAMRLIGALSSLDEKKGNDDQ